MKLRCLNKYGTNQGAEAQGNAQRKSIKGGREREREREREKERNIPIGVARGQETWKKREFFENPNPKFDFMQG